MERIAPARRASAEERWLARVRSRLEGVDAKGGEFLGESFRRSLWAEAGKRVEMSGAKGNAPGIWEYPVLSDIVDH